MVIADAGIQVMVVVIGKVDVAVVDRPGEVVVLVLIGTVFIIIHLRARPVVGVCVVGYETDTGVVGVEGVFASSVVNIGVVHSEVALPFAREHHGLVGIFDINA